MQISQEYFTAIVYAKFGGQTEYIMDNWKIVNWFYLVQQVVSVISFVLSICTGGFHKVVSVLWIFFRTTDTTIWKPGFTPKLQIVVITVVAHKRAITPQTPSQIVSLQINCIFDDSGLSINQQPIIQPKMENNAPINLKTILERIFTKCIHLLLWLVSSRYR